MTSSGLKITPPAGTSWSDGYIKYDNVCHKVKYHAANEGNHNINASYTISGKPNNTSKREYQIVVNIKNINFDIGDTDDGDSKEVAVSIGTDGGDSWIGNIYSGSRVYETSKDCDDYGNNFKVGGMSLLDNEHIYVNTNIKLSYRDENDGGKIKTLNSDQLYFELTDIDGAQAYKIQAPTNNWLSKENMFAASAEALQPDAERGDKYKTDLKNKFVTSNDGNYIYSEYTTDKTTSAANNQFDIKSGSDVYVKLGEDAQNDGVDMIFGFTIGAGSNVRYFAKQLKVTYDSDKNGEISKDCITSEEVVSGNNPFGSCSTPNEDYEFTYWIADKNVVLDDGEKIDKGEPLTPEQVKRVVVKEEVNFTAIHESTKKPVEPAAPDTGASTSEMNAAQIATISVAGVLMFGLAIRLLPRLFRNKVKFD